MSKRYTSTPAWLTHIMRERVSVEKSKRSIKGASSSICGSIVGIVASTPLSAIYNYNLEDATSDNSYSGGSDD